MIPALLLSLALPVRAEPFLDGLSAYESKNFTTAASLFEKAAAEGNDYAKAYLGNLYQKGDGVAADPVKARELYAQAAKAGNPLGDVGLGLTVSQWSEAEKHFAAAADAGSKMGMLDLAVARVANHESGWYFDAAQTFQRLADDQALGRIAKQDLYYAFMHGYGVREDHAKAQQIIESTGDQYYLGKIKEGQQSGFDYPPQIWEADGFPGGDKGYAWIREDAAAMRPSAVYLLGAMYEEGVGVSQDKQQAARYYAKAAELGYAQASKRLRALGVAPAAVSDEAPVAEQAPAEPAAPAPRKVHSDVDAPRFKLASRPHDFALVIGVEKYKSIPAAKYAERDAAAFKAHAAALGIPARNIVSLIGEDATRTKIQAYLEEWLPKNVKSDSTLLVYYSGHGAPDAQTQQAYLMPWDADPEFLKTTGYPLKQLYGSLGRLKAKTIVVALDSCFSGAGGRSVLAPGVRPLVTQVKPVDASPRLTILAAASGEQVTGSLDDQGHGMFTYYLLKGIDEAAKDGSAVLTARGLYASVKERVEDESARQNRRQTPQLAGPDAVLATLK